MTSLLITSFFLFIHVLVFGQVNNEQISPQAKNSKPWDQKAKASRTSILIKPGNKPVGPKAKNLATQHRIEGNTTLIKIRQRNPHRKGPKAKNYKPWND